MKHLHHQFIAAQEREGDNFKEMTTVSVTGYQKEEEALIAAKEVINRPVWYLSKVWECSTCALESEKAASDRYMHILLSKFLKKELNEDDENY